MKICSLTVTSRTRAHCIEAALRSVESMVDGFLLLELDNGSDNTIGIARSVGGERLVVHTVPMEGGMATWRNALLDMAETYGFDWAVQLDTDEVIHWNGENLRRLLERAPLDVYGAPCANGVYGKPRFFRIPCSHRWVAHIHEDLRPGGTIHDLGRVTFSEPQKTKEQMVASRRGYLDGLEAQMKAEPSEGRWRLYAGAVHEILENAEEANFYYRTAARLFREPDMSAWALIRTARLCLKVGDYPGALSSSIGAMELAPYLAEAQCCAARACLALGRHNAALTWAHFATMNNAKSVRRVSMCEPPALWEEPFRIMAEAYAALGQVGKAEEALIAAQRKLEERQ